MDLACDVSLSDEAINLIARLMQCDPRFRISDLEVLYPGFKKSCYQLCISYIEQFFLQDLNFVENKTLRRKYLRDKLGVTPNYERFYNYLVDFLIEQQVLYENNNGALVFTKSKIDKIYLKDLLLKFPMFEGTLAMLDHCVREYSDVFTGKKYALSVLFPEGKTTFLDDMLSNDSAMYSEMPTLTNLLVEVIANLSVQKPLRILEIGGGRGLLTKQLIGKLQGEYYYRFTDVSNRFLIDMKQYVAHQNIPEKQFSVSCFDITCASGMQDVEFQGYDVIVGLDVLHVAPDLVWCINNLQTLLKTNGLLFLLETTRSYAWQNMTMGLATGWWNFADKWRTNTPIIDAPQWERVFSASSMQLLKATTLQNPNSNAALLIAR